MFFYLSFLRPPPLQAGPYGTISITPQISNDLRTEYFDGTQDLYYSWSREDDAVPVATKAVKLTTWRPATAYKEIPLPVPPGVREGQSWRLMLMGQQQAIGQVHPESIDLSSTKVGRLPIPVLSMPVLFVGKGFKSSPKQEMIQRKYLIPYRGIEGGEVVRKLASLTFSEKTTFDLDKKIWDSGIGLCSWIIELQGNSALIDATPALKDLHASLFSDQPRKILELGAGIGMLSVALAVMRSALFVEDHGDNILATDVESAIPLLEQNISENSQYYTLTKPHTLVLDWGDQELPEEVRNLGELDAIVMADVTYNTTFFPALSRTLSRLSRMGSRPPAILLGYKERDETERSFWDLAAAAGIRFQNIGGRDGAGGAPVEIWLGYFEV